MIDDVPVDLFGNGIELHAFRFIDRIEQGRERVAQVKAASTAVADVEHPLQLFHQRSLIEELLGLPCHRMSCGRLKAAFSFLHGSTRW